MWGGHGLEKEFFLCEMKYYLARKDQESFFLFSGENTLSKTGTSDFALMHFPIKLYGDISKL